MAICNPEAPGKAESDAGVLTIMSCCSAPLGGAAEASAAAHHHPAGEAPGRSPPHRLDLRRHQWHLDSAPGHMGEPPLVAATDAPCQHTTEGTSAQASDRGHGQRQLSATMIDPRRVKVSSGHDGSCREHVSMAP
jgi:hypothetical protein